jgi:hypothetical protein
VRKILRAAIGIVAFLEGLAFFAGAALHLGLQLPVPWVEARSFSSVLLETASGVVLVLASAAIMARRRPAWKLAVAGHVVGVASIAWGIATGGSFANQSSHHSLMLLLLIVVLIGLATPPCRHALENGRRRSRRRKRVLQTY